MSVQILQGDCREVLKTLPAESVDCVVTSPPYWGLRDYQTATWEGGDADCDHRSPTMREGRNEDRAKLAGSDSTNRDQLLLAHRSGCGKCGAVKVDRQLGLEPTLGEHIETMVGVFREVRRVLKKTGTVWLNYGDCYATSPNGRSAADTKAAGNDDRTFRDKPFSTIGGVLKAKDLCMIPNRLAIALQEDGWWVRSEIVWAKPNPMPESIRDRPTSSHEKIFLLTKADRYFYDADAVKEPMKDVSLQRLSQPNVLTQPGGPKDSGTGNRSHKKALNNQAERLIRHEKWKTRFEGWDAYDKSLGRNLRNVWEIGTAPFPGAHFATFPPELAERCIKAGCPAEGTVLDPFGGAGTTGLVADRLQRNSIIIELNPDYAVMSERRLNGDAGMFASVQRQPSLLDEATA